MPLNPERNGQRVLFAEWLVSAVGSGLYQGLCWVDAAHTRFRVPWKHFSRKDISQQDSQIFQAWAVARGRCQGATKAMDWTKLKTNFRCALVSTRQFMLWEDNSHHPLDPHKVFALRHPQPGAPDLHVNEDEEEEQEEEEGSGINPESIPDCAPSIQLEDILQILSLDEQSCGAAANPEGFHVSSDYAPGYGAQVASPDLLQLALEQSQLTQVGYCPAGVWGQGDGPRHPGAPLVEPGAGGPWGPPGPEGESSSLWTAPATPARTGAAPYEAPEYPRSAPAEDSGTWAVLPRRQPPLADPAPLTCGPDLGARELEVTILYKGQPVHWATVVQGHCVLTYWQGPAGGHPCDPQLVPFPSPSELPDLKQVRYTLRLLDHVGPGLRVQLRDRKLLATRWGKCKVYWELAGRLTPPGPHPDPQPEPRLLPRGAETPIFDFNDFLGELKDFHEGRRSSSPDYTIYLAFGQTLSTARPKEKNLILVKLVPRVCALYVEKVQRAGASSLSSASLSLHLSASLDGLLDIESLLMELDPQG
uniref:Interferon regulatory factor 7 n=1 Tax=Ornithorhynchus anatinus TaxID=9258 RepID=A0A6I8N578_ORNAN